MTRTLRAYSLLGLLLASYPLQYGIVLFLLAGLDELDIYFKYDYAGRWAFWTRLLIIGVAYGAMRLLLTKLKQRHHDISKVITYLFNILIIINNILYLVILFMLFLFS